RVRRAGTWCTSRRKACSRSSADPTGATFTASPPTNGWGLARTHATDPAQTQATRGRRHMRPNLPPLLRVTGWRSHRPPLDFSTHRKAMRHDRGPGSARVGRAYGHLPEGREARNRGRDAYVDEDLQRPGPPSRHEGCRPGPREALRHALAQLVL